MHLSSLLEHSLSRILKSSKVFVKSLEFGVFARFANQHGKIARLYC